MHLSDLLYVVLALVVLVLALAPLACWMALGRIERILKDRLPPNGKAAEYNAQKRLMLLQDLVTAMQDRSPDRIRGVAGEHLSYGDAVYRDPKTGEFRKIAKPK